MLGSILRGRQQVQLPTRNRSKAARHSTSRGLSVPNIGARAAAIFAVCVLALVGLFIGARNFGWISKAALIRVYPKSMPIAPSAGQEVPTAIVLVRTASCGELSFTEYDAWDAGVRTVNEHATSMSSSSEVSGESMGDLWMRFAARFATGMTVSASGRHNYVTSGETVIQQLQAILGDALAVDLAAKATTPSSALVMECELGRLATAIVTSSFPANDQPPAPQASLGQNYAQDTHGEGSFSVSHMQGHRVRVVCMHRTAEEQLVASREMYLQPPPVPESVAHVVAAGPWASWRLGRNTKFDFVLGIEPSRLYQPLAWQVATIRDACKLLHSGGISVLAFAPEAVGTTRGRQSSACSALAAPPVAVESSRVVRVDPAEIKRYVRESGCSVSAIVELPRHSSTTESTRGRSPVVVKAIVFSKD